MSQTEAKEPVEHILASLQGSKRSYTLDEIKSMEDLSVFVRRHSNRMHTLLLIRVRRPDALQKWPELWEETKDVYAGIVAGSLPKPSWWDLAHSTPIVPDTEGKA